MNAPVALAAPGREALLDRLLRLRALRPLDAELGRLVLQLDAVADAALGLAAAAASQAVAQGHSCLPLQHVHEVLATAAPVGAALPELPDAAALGAALRASHLVGHAATATDARLPLWLDGADRLYLGRHYQYEGRVAAVLRRLAAADTVPAADSAATGAADGHALLARHFTLGGAGIDWQAVAVATGLSSSLAVITGGPGTGKTTTVLWLLAALVEQALESGNPPPRVHLAAPTGKAAARLGETLRQRLPQLDIDAAVRAAIPTSASTLHRLLGSLPDSSRFRHGRAHPLDTDVVVVDEVSMVDLPLMAKLLDALPPQARLVLLGDRDQLASVEAGNVLAAICAAAGEGGMSPARAAWLRAITGFAVPQDAAATRFADVVVELRDSHRFGTDSGLGRLASSIRRGDDAGLVSGLRDGAFVGVTREIADDPATLAVRRCGEALAALPAQGDAAAALQAASRLRILTALREGPSGCVTINAALEQFLRRQAGVAAHERWYPGRLLLVTENDYGTELFNGDIGIVLADADGGLAAWFPSADGGVRSLPQSALPAHDSAFAMTIHKSQGSEFDEVLIVLPRDDARVLGRELLYTAVTRARQRVHLVADDDTLTRTVGRSTRRHSGLADRLRAGHTAPHS